MQLKNNVIKKLTDKTFLIRSYIIILVITNLSMALMFLSGINSFGNRSTTLTYAIQLAFNIFELSELKNVTNCMVGIFYFIALVPIIKESVSSLRYFKPSEKLVGKPETQLVSLTTKTINCSACVLLFAIMCEMAMSTKLSGGVIISMIIGLAAFFITRLMIYDMRNYSLKSILLNLGYSAIPIFGTYILIFTLWSPQVSEFLSKIKYLKIMNNISMEEPLEFMTVLLTALLNIIAPIVYLIILFLCHNILKRINDTVIYEGSTIKKNATSILTQISFLCIFEFVLFVLNEGKMTPANIFRILSPYMTILLVSIGIYIAALIKNDGLRCIRKEKKKINSTEETPEITAA